MKLLSFLISLLLHLLFIFLFLLIIKPLSKPIKTPPVYTVTIVNLNLNKIKVHKKAKPNIKIQKKKIKSIKKPTETPKKAIVTPKKEVKNKPQKTKPKPKLKKIKKKIKKPKHENKKPKPNIEKKIQLLREKILINSIKEKLLREKIKEIREHILSQEEAEKAYKQKLTENYIQIIQSIIYNNWGVEKSVIQNKILVTEVDIKLDYLGNLIKLRIVKSSGNAYFDGTVINAIKSSVPFPKPPKDILTSGTVEFIITFDSREKQ